MNQKLVEDNMSLVYAFLHQTYPAYAFDEDMIQCGMIGLCRAANSWDETKASFSHFAWSCIRNEILREFKQRSKHKGVLSLDKVSSASTSDSDYTLDEFLVGDADVDWVDFDGFYQRLTSTERKLVDMLLQGTRIKDISAKLGVSCSYIHELRRKMRAKWRRVNESYR